jgi:hypothetical protein
VSVASTFPLLKYGLKYGRKVVAPSKPPTSDESAPHLAAVPGATGRYVFLRKVMFASYLVGSRTSYATGTGLCGILHPDFREFSF